MATSGVGFLTVEDTAEMLGVDELAINRLIAHRAVAASQIGGVDGAWMVDESSLGKLIKAGAPNLALPPIDDAGAFFTPTWGTAQQFNESLQAAAITDGQILAESAMLTMFAELDDRPQTRADSIDMRLKMTPAVQKALAAPPPTLAFRPDTAPPPRLEETRWLYLWVAAQLRLTVNVAVQGAYIGKRPVDVLYRSPDDYQRIITAARDTVLGKNLGFGRTARRAPPNIDQWVSVFYLLPVRQVIAATEINGLIESSF